MARDVGSSSKQGGQFDHYCYSWVGGYVSERDHLKQTETRVEPTETADGWVGYYCARCGKQIVEQVLPATGPVNRTRPRHRTRVRHRIRNPIRRKIRPRPRDRIGEQADRSVARGADAAGRPEPTKRNEVAAS